MDKVYLFIYYSFSSWPTGWPEYTHNRGAWKFVNLLEIQLEINFLVVFTRILYLLALSLCNIQMYLCITNCYKSKKS